MLDSAANRSQTNIFLFLLPQFVFFHLYPLSGCSQQRAALANPQQPAGHRWCYPRCCSLTCVERQELPTLRSHKVRGWLRTGTPHSPGRVSFERRISTAGTQSCCSGKMQFKYYMKKKKRNDIFKDLLVLPVGGLCILDNGGGFTVTYSS